MPAQHQTCFDNAAAPTNSFAAGADLSAAAAVEQTTEDPWAAVGPAAPPVVGAVAVGEKEVGGAGRVHMNPPWAAS
jgi:hypothetical protein